MIRKIYGPPGTGKTTKLINYVKTFYKLGTPLDKIGYFAFTTKAATEATNRMLDAYKHLQQKALKNFKVRVPDFPDEQMICDDFFNIDGNFDLIIEQTFFCAIDIEKRNDYAKKVHSLLSDNGKLVGLMFNAPMYSDHPPFGGSVKEYKSYFSTLFNYKYFEPAYNSIPSRNGKELFINLIKK